MSNMEEIRNGIVEGLHEHTGVIVVPADTTDRKPDYPYITYKILSSSNNANTFSLVDEPVPSANPEYDFDILTTRIEQPYFTLSINTYSDCEITSGNLVSDARDWFVFHGELFFMGLNIVIVSAGNISDRAQQIVDDYESRYGFDVRIRTARAMSRRVATIEDFTLGGMINHQEHTETT